MEKSDSMVDQYLTEAEKLDDAISSALLNKKDSQQKLKRPEKVEIDSSLNGID